MSFWSAPASTPARRRAWPVSYTHLALGPGNALIHGVGEAGVGAVFDQGEVGAAAVAAGLLQTFIGGTAVSYTHLDVYKRQVQLLAGTVLENVLHQRDVPQLFQCFGIGGPAVLRLFAMVQAHGCLLYTSRCV